MTNFRLPLVFITVCSLLIGSVPLNVHATSALTVAATGDDLSGTNQQLARARWGLGASGALLRRTEEILRLGLGRVDHRLLPGGSVTLPPDAFVGENTSGITRVSTLIGLLLVNLLDLIYSTPGIGPGYH